jgi:hypothetical protein
MTRPSLQRASGATGRSDTAYGLWLIVSAPVHAVGTGVSPVGAPWRWMQWLGPPRLGLLRLRTCWQPGAGSSPSRSVCHRPVCHRRRGPRLNTAGSSRQNNQ